MDTEIDSAQSWLWRDLKPITFWHTIWSTNNYASILAGIFVTLIQFQVTSSQTWDQKKKENHLIFSSAEPGQQNLLMLGIIYVHNLLIMKIMSSDEK